MRVQVVTIDRSVTDAILEGGQISGQLQGPGRSHRVADEALRIVDPRILACCEDFLDGQTLLDIAALGGGGVRADQVDVRWVEPGALNAITDVAGVKVGHTTIVSGDNVRTGVTAVLPHGGNLFQEKVPGAVFIGNAFGKLAGSTQVQELGTIETPIILTNTLAVGTAIEATVAWTLAQSGNEQVRSVNALVGETNDGTLNDIRGGHVQRSHVAEAIRNASDLLPEIPSS